MEQREEGGNNGFVWQLPTRLKFSNVKLTRPVCADTTEVMKWFASMATGVTPKTANISAMTAERKVVASWGLLGVDPRQVVRPQPQPRLPQGGDRDPRARPPRLHRREARRR